MSLILNVRVYFQERVMSRSSRECWCQCQMKSRTRANALVLTRFSAFTFVLDSTPRSGKVELGHSSSQSSCLEKDAQRTHSNAVWKFLQKNYLWSPEVGVINWRSFLLLWSRSPKEAWLIEGVSICILD